MLKFGNKEFRNLQEQVEKNMKDILFILQEEGVLNEFGIKVIGQEDTVASMPTVSDYKEDNPDWSYGDTYAIGTSQPYTLYVLTRANGTHPDDYWFNIGSFPAPGPQGETGAQGPVGPQGPQGNTGANGTPAGFGTITATAETLVPGSSATATVVASGPDSEKSFAFTFGIPRGQDGDDLDVNWGEIEGTLSNQTDLQDALDDKQDAILNYDSSTSNSVTFKDNIILKNESNQTTTIGRASGLAISTDQVTILNASNDAIIPNLNIRPLRDNAISIGNDIARIKDIKMAGVIGDGTHTFTLPSNTGTLLTNNDLNGYATQTWVNQQGFITGITSSDVVSALGYTPGTSNFSGSYNDLSNKPTIPSVSGTNDGTNWTSITIDSDTYAIPVGGTSGITDVTLGGTSVVTNNVAVLPAYPVVPTMTSELTNDSGFITASDIPTNVSSFNNDAGYITSSDLTGYATESWVGQQGYLTSVSWSDVSGKPTFATVATSGDYDDLSNKPTIPVVPTNVSAFTNDAGYITSASIPTNYVTTNTNQTITGQKTFGLIKITSVPLGGTTTITRASTSANYTVQLPLKNGTLATTDDIPTVVSDLTNDSGYQTASDVATAIASQTKETWTFEVDDGQGGTTTVTKTIVLG